MNYEVSYLEEYKVIRKVTVLIEADDEEEAVERVEFGEYDEILDEDEIVSEKLVYKDWSSIEVEEVQALEEKKK